MAETAIFNHAIRLVKISINDSTVGKPYYSLYYFALQFTKSLKRTISRKIFKFLYNPYVHTFPVAIVFSITASAQENNSDSTRYTPVKHGEKGFEFRTRDDRFLLQVQGRLQFRFATPEDQDPVTFDDFEGGKSTSFAINRARLKVGGHAFQPWIKYYWEYELSQSNLLNFTISIEKWEWLKFMVGQWKVE